MGRKTDKRIDGDAEVLEDLLRGLLVEVGVRDALRAISQVFCAGCIDKRPAVRYCEAARIYLKELDRQREAADA